MKIKSIKKNTTSFKPDSKRKNQRIKVLSLVILFILSGFHPLTGHAQNEKVSINARRSNLKEVIREIEKQTDYLFVYNSNEVNLNSPIAVDVKDQPVTEVLTTVFKDTDIRYHIEGNSIMLVNSDVVKKQINGNIIDETGEPMIGAAVMIKGTNNGTITNIDGDFSLNAAKGDILTISYLGYNTQNITVTDLNFYKINMTLETQELGAVVVTALGIKRSEKSLSYNVQQVNQDELTRVKDANLINSLAGKVAGVSINSSSSGVGGATKVVMRGAKSIGQTSNALYVIDGVPMFSSGAGGDSEFGSAGSTEPIADINPEDIESISVLTGPAASALYGNDAARGVIMITTKKGQAGKTSVTVSQNTEFLRPFVMPRFQNRYGTGTSLFENQETDKSWGPLLNQSNYRGYSPKNDYFTTGVVATESVSLSTGTQNNQTYVSASAVDSKGMIPNNSYTRYNFTFRNTTTFLKDKMALDVGGSYIKQADLNMVNQGVYQNPLVTAYLFPRGEDWEDVKMYEHYSTQRKISEQNWKYGIDEYVGQNPYWINYRNQRKNKKDRYMFNASLSYDILDWLNVTGRVRIDNAETEHSEKLFATTNTTLTGGSNNGFYNTSRNTHKQTYADILVNINKSFAEHFTIQSNIGASYSDIRELDLSIGGPIVDTDLESGVPNVFTLEQLDKAKLSPSRNWWVEQTQSIFASVELGYKGAYYLTLTGRNDWPSQLAGEFSKTKSFFYPSVGTSFILSEIFDLPQQINYLKVRGSFASVGIPIPRSLANLTYGWDGSSNIYTGKNHFPLSELKPERTNSWEIGLTTRVFRNFNIDLSLYTAETTNQTFDPLLSVSSGYKKIYVQSGSVQNKGIEFSLGYNNTWKNFGWSSTYILTMNKNKVKEVIRDVTNPITGDLINMDRFEASRIGNARFYVNEGGTLGDLYSVFNLKRDSNGDIYVDEKGNISSVGVDPIKLGTVFPKANMSWRNDFSWKNFNAGFMVSARLGGIVYSATQAIMDRYGVSETSAIVRDNGGMTINNGDVINPENWYATIGQSMGLPQYYTYSATNVRLQEASIGYTFTKKQLAGVCDATISLVGRNLWMIYNKAPYDPESVATTGNYYQGVDYFIMPSTRNLGFNVRVTF